MDEEKPISPLKPFGNQEQASGNFELLAPLRQELAATNLRLREALDKADGIQYQYDRQSYYIKVFFDINRARSGLRDMEALLEQFLRMTLDSLGVEEGGAFLFASGEKRTLAKYLYLGKVTQRFSPEELETLKARLNEMAAGWGLLSTETRSLTLEQLSSLAITPAPPPMAFYFTLSESYIGLVILGKKLNALRFTLEEEAFLINLVGNLAILLERAKTFEKIQALHLDMAQKNIFLQKAMVDLNVSESRVKGLEKSKPQFRQAVKKELERSRRVSVLDFLLIIGLGVVLGVIFNLVNPNGINPIPSHWFQRSLPQVDAGRIKWQVESGQAVLVDARPDFLYKQGHIRGAVNLPLVLFDFVYLMKFSHLDPERELIVYGRNISRHYDQEVALQLSARGHTRVKILSGGLKSWQERGFPIEP